MPILKTLAALALIGSSATASAALAREQWVDAGTGFAHLFAQAAPVAQMQVAARTQIAATDGEILDVGEVVDRLTAQGYTDIHEIEREKGRYEVKARASDGTRQELYVDAKTGTVLEIEEDDD